MVKEGIKKYFFEVRIGGYEKEIVASLKRKKTHEFTVKEKDEATLVMTGVNEK